MDLWFRNFQSYGNNVTQIQLNKPGTHLITGTNGTGKSTIIQALVFLLYGKVISQTKATEPKVDELINNINKKQLEVGCTLFKSNNGYYKIIRARKMKSGAEGNYIKIYFNADEPVFLDESEITLGGSGTTDKFIESIIGMPFEMFVRIVVVSATNTPFLDLPVSSATQTSQISCIERLFNITVLSEKGNALKQVMKGTDDCIKLLKRDIEHQEKTKARDVEYLASLQTNAEKWDDNRKAQIAKLEQQLLESTDVDVEAEQLLHEQLVDINKNKSILEKQHAKLENTLSSKQNSIDKLSKEIKHLEASTCPYCMQAYYDANKLQELQDNVKSAKELIEAIEPEYQILADSIQEFADSYKTISTKLTTANLTELIKIRDQSTIISTKISELCASTNTYIEQIEEFEGQVAEDPDYTELHTLNNVSDHQQFLYKLLTKKDSFIRKKLLHTNLTYLNNQLHGYLQLLELPFKVSFNYQMMAEITQLGRQTQFSLLSNGQRARVNLALTMSFRDVLQKMHAPINICLLDESLDVGLDSQGVQSAIRMLKTKALEDNTTIFIITHRDEPKASFDNIINVHIENEFSVIT